MKLTNIALHGVPRSGTTWIGAILDSSEEVVYRNQPLFSFSFKSFLTNKSSKEKINRFFKLISKSDDEFILQEKGKSEGLIPVFKKKKINKVIYKEARYHNILRNLLIKDESVKVIGIIRNPKSVLSSWINAPKEFDLENWSIVREWRDASKKNKDHVEEFYGYNKWKEVANLFLDLEKKYPKRFYLINYKSLLENTEREVNELFKFCELKIDSQTKDFINNKFDIDKSNNAYSVYRVSQTDDKWKTFLPNEIIDEIDNDLKGTRLEKYLY